MSSISFDLSGKIDQPTVNALSLLKRVADALGIPFFVVGASARDILLKHCYGIDPPRATRDVDLGVRVADWEKYNRLTDALIATEKFAATRERQRFCFDSTTIRSDLFTKVDLTFNHLTIKPLNILITYARHQS
ncbi:MAG: hypothetical protein L6300_14335 [Syntrophaceae bacterium]|nr:hypothetical protein [Syntrophaceae bacterium]